MIVKLKLTEFVDFCSKRNLSFELLEETYLFNEHHYDLFKEDCPFIDHSFVKISDDGAVFFPLTEFGGLVTFFGRPIKSFSANKNFKFEMDVDEYFKQLILNGKKLLLAEELGLTSDIINSQSKKFYSSVVNLIQEEKDLLNDMSKGHKADVQKGRKILDVSICDYQNFDLTELVSFRDLYTEISQTSKSDVFWSACFNMVRENSAFVVKAYLQNELVSASFFMNGKSTVYYALGCYRRDKMYEKIPLGHFPMYKALLYSKHRCFKNFELGFFIEEDGNQKTKSIFDFKRRFSSQLVSETCIRQESL